MSKPVKMARDGLPSPLPVRPIFNPLSLVLGALLGLAVTVLLQQAGRIVASTVALFLGVLLGLVVGIVLPSIPYMVSARNANSKLAEERKRRATLGLASKDVASTDVVAPKVAT